MTKISIVTPTFNEEQNIEKLCSEIKIVMEKLDLGYEHIIIDNASTDNTIKILKEICSKDKNIKAARVYSPSKLSKFNSPKNKSSLQAEIFVDNKENVTREYLNYVKNNTVENLVKIGIFEKKDLEVVNVKFLKYANVIFDKNCSRNRSLILEYFKKYNVDFVGRFGKWAYLWSDDCFLSGKLTAEKIYKNPN